jgi:hypothetical protein
MFEGHETAGAWRSTILIVNEQVVEFPEASTTRKTLVVNPKGNADPEGKPDNCVSVEPGQLSLVTGALYVTTALH